MNHPEDKSRQAKIKSAAKLADYYLPAAAKKKPHAAATTDQSNGDASHAPTATATRLADFNGAPTSNTVNAPARSPLNTSWQLRAPIFVPPQSQPTPQPDRLDQPELENGHPDLPDYDDDVMTDFDAINGTDPQEAVGKISTVKVAWNEAAVEYFFFELENQMELINLQSQWLKRVILANNLPETVKNELMTTLKKTKTQAPTNVYKVLKDKILALFGPKEGDKYEKALQLQLNGKPSALAKQLAELLCKCDPPLSEQNCCAVDTVTAMWRRALPQVVRSAVAGRSLKGTNFDQVLQTADDVYASIAPGAAAAVAAVAIPAEAEASDDQVAAIRRAGRARPRGFHQSRGAPRGRGQARGTSRPPRWSTTPPASSPTVTPRHPDNPPEGSCPNHWKHGRGTFNCTFGWETCPWKHILAPRPN